MPAQINQRIAEATIRARGATLHANPERPDMYTAIDSLADKLDWQVLKHKENSTSHHRGTGSLKKPDTL